MSYSSLTPYQTLFVLALLYEYGKREVTETLLEMNKMIIALAEAYDMNHPKPDAPCLRTILCERTVGLHHYSCPINSSYTCMHPYRELCLAGIQ